MPKQRARRRAAPVDLRDLDPVESSEVQALLTTIRMPKRSGQTRPVNVSIQTSVCTSQNQSEQVGQQISSPVASQLPTADQIATSLMQQLKDSGLQLINRSDNAQTVPDSNLARVPSQSSQDHPNQQQSVMATLIPPVLSDPDLINTPPTNATGISNQHFSSLGLSTSSMGNTAGYLIKNTLPLGFHVKDEVKTKIWSDQYVEFSKLLPNFNEDDDDDDVLFRTQTVKITKNGKQRQLMSIHQWNSALTFLFPSIMRNFHM